MFTEIEIETNNVEDIYVHSLNVLCSDSMFILQNNSKVLKFLTDESLSAELDMIVKSAHMAIKHARFELLQNIILGLKDQVHKLAALEIKYFDEYEVLLRTDIYNAFMPKNFKKHGFVAPALKEIFKIFDETVKLSPTNAAFALKTAFDVGEQSFARDVLINDGLTEEFIRQIHKRYHANFGMTLEDELKKISQNYAGSDEIKNILSKAI